jgi:flavin-binding protein dodecin
MKGTNTLADFAPALLSNTTNLPPFVKIVNFHDFFPAGNGSQNSFIPGCKTPPAGLCCEVLMTAQTQDKKSNMKDHVYKLIELTGTSTVSIEEAIGNAIQRAHKTIKNLSWFQVVETRGNIKKGKVEHWQVTLKVGFTVEG